MKKIVLVVLIVFAITSVALAGGRTRVKGYFRSDGTYVQPHYRTAPNKSRRDNYSYPGNFNPNKGSFTPYSTSPRENYPSNPNPYNKYRDTYSLP